MSLDDRVRLEIDVEFADGPATGVFEMGPADEGSFAINERVEINYLLQSFADQVSGALDAVTTTGENTREDISIDIGAGVHTIELDFQNPGPNPDYQWGSSDDPAVGPNEKTATGADPIQQSQTFLNYFRIATFGSMNPIRVQFGEYHDTGYLEDFLEMTPEAPGTVYNNQDHAKWDGTITLLAVRDLREQLDSISQVLG